MAKQGVQPKIYTTLKRRAATWVVRWVKKARGERGRERGEREGREREGRERGERGACGDLGGKVGEGGAGISCGGHVAAQGGQGGGGLAQGAARLVHQQHLAHGHSEGERERRE